MRSIIAASVVALTLLLAAVCVTPALAGSNCENPLTTRCNIVTDQNYQGGGHNPKTVPITACLPDDLYRGIKLGDGSSAWEVGFYYGGAEPEVVKTVRNDQCWTHSKSGARQQGHPGSYVIAFICCGVYCGWVAGEIQNDGTVHLQRFVLPEAHDPMRKYRQGNSYNKDEILN